MEHLRTATGKEFDSDYLATIPMPELLYTRVIGKSFAEIAAVFSDPRETVQLWHGDNHLINYTKLISIAQEYDAIKICLAKE